MPSKRLNTHNKTVQLCDKQPTQSESVEMSFRNLCQWSKVTRYGLKFVTKPHGRYCCEIKKMTCALKIHKMSSTTDDCQIHKWQQHSWVCLHFLTHSSVPPPCFSFLTLSSLEDNERQSSDPQRWTRLQASPWQHWPQSPKPTWGNRELCSSVTLWPK